jgi:hypothetical protein
LFILALPILKKNGIQFAISYTINTEYSMRKIFFILFAFSILTVKAQTTEDDPFGSDYNFDSTTVEEEEIIDEPKKKDGIKPYERFKCPIDTISNLITYMGVVPFTPMENDVYDGGTIDSLYLRAKKYLMQQFIPGYKENPKKPLVFPKDMLIEDYKPDGDVGRIIIRVTVPLMIKNNSFSSAQQGTVTFKIEIRVKDDKYKYKFTNFVHNTTAKGSEKPIKTYMEYYANQTKGLRSNDLFLLAIDRIVKNTIKDLGKVMKDPIVIDEDDF